MGTDGNSVFLLRFIYGMLGKAKNEQAFSKEYSLGQITFRVFSDPLRSLGFKSGIGSVTFSFANFAQISWNDVHTRQ